MMNNKKVPQIRLKGFNGEWKEATFGESVVINSGMDYKHLSEGNIPVYGTGGYMLSVNDSLSEIDAIGIGRKGTIDKPQLLKAPFWTVDTLFFMTPKDQDLNFLYALCQKINWRKYDESTGVPSLSKVNISKIDFAIPEKDEQQAIASFFQHLDSRIQSTTKKIESLKQMKAASLQAMFPQEGETTPKVRFKGFEGEWKKTSFSSLYERSILKNDLSFGVDKIISVANMHFVKGTQNADEDYLKSYNIMRQGDIAFEGNKSKHFAHGRLVENTIGDGIVSHVFVVMKPISEKYDLNFWKYYINNEDIMGDKLVRCTKSSTMMTDIVIDDFLKESILVPSYEEQVQIGNILTSLDQQIFLQSQRLEKLKQIKAACLDKMFV